MTFLNADAKIATHAALSQNVHGVGANDIADINDISNISNLPTLQNRYNLGDTIRLSHDAVRSVSFPVSPVKLKTITLDTLHPTTSTIRIKFSGDSNYVDTYAAIYKNGVKVGANRDCYNGYNTWSQDLSFTEGDTVELWGWRPAGAQIGSVKDFRITSGDYSFTYREATTLDDAGVATPLAGTNSTP